MRKKGPFGASTFVEQGDEDPDQDLETTEKAPQPAAAGVPPAVTNIGRKNELFAHIEAAASQLRTASMPLVTSAPAGENTQRLLNTFHSLLGDLEQLAERLGSAPADSDYMDVARDLQATLGQIQTYLESLPAATGGAGLATRSGSSKLTWLLWGLGGFAVLGGGYLLWKNRDKLSKKK